MKMSRKISKNDRLLRDKIIHQEWKQDRDLIKKVIKSGILNKKESLNLIHIFQGHICGYWVGDINYGFNLGEKLKKLVK